MNIEKIADYLEKAANENHREVISIILEAVMDYPERELNDTSIYFKRVKEILGTNEISLNNLINFLYNQLDWSTEADVWIHQSMSTLYEAFDLMRLKQLNFSEILQVIENIDG